ncbi:hypothetical protein ACJJI5_10520 [Microbulbifer sp. EKSA008]|uniref:hypothetical protein n=1 Tax=unclassified Microbulbifer TaxID=2619833 RepID=UPI00403A1A05
MQFFKNLFKKKEPAEALIHIQGLGTLEWDKESEYWLGKQSGYKFSVSYDGLSKPTDELVKSVMSAFAEPSYIDDTVVKIKNLAKEKYPIDRHKEIDSLVAKDIVFQNQNFILIQFFESDDEPFWFAEVHGAEIYVGCDT